MSFMALVDDNEIENEDDDEEELEQEDDEAWKYIDLKQQIRQTGVVILKKERSHWFLIKPDAAGYDVVIGFKQDVVAMNSRKIAIGDHLEFNVVPNSQCRARVKQRAIFISAGGLKPLLSETGSYGNYLMARLHLPTKQSLLPEVPVTPFQSNTLQGWISGFDSTYLCGTIEVKAPDNKRYRKIQFYFKDCILEPIFRPYVDIIRRRLRDRYDTSLIPLMRIKIGEEVQFQISALESDNSDQSLVDRELHPELTQKAINICSINHSFLRVKKLETSSNLLYTDKNIKPNSKKKYLEDKGK
ncbi:hypothetical protein RFI_34662 [Reticulomyxa filosa]|uniref:Uncharacterized protein n=1 Tax=Reticulomyxa filosa TaxID=46433 RepID=X6LMA4_RETFI|nr:hypothetical protein RFI_34662 [Reticulomyxa filosa]|eukprot:ETO02749.1 hypothetical protein RFI_34662 [Reticulomyxa filosa]